MDLPKRKPNRLPDFDYSTPGAYFITICTEGKRNILGSIVGGGALDAPHTRLSYLGHVAEKYILTGNRISGIHVDKFVIMPNHIHLILLVDAAPLTGTSRRRPLQMPPFRILYPPLSGFAIKIWAKRFFSVLTTIM